MSVIEEIKALCELRISLLVDLEERQTSVCDQGKIGIDRVEIGHGGSSVESRLQMRGDPRFDAFGDNRRQCQCVERVSGDSGRTEIAELLNQPHFPKGIEEECGAQHERDRDSSHLVSLGAIAEKDYRNQDDGDDYYDSVSIEERGTGTGEKNADAQRDQGETTEEKSQRAERYR